MIIAATILFLIAFAISLVGVGLARRYALRLGLMDDPGHRKVHTVATPRNGGIGIFWGFAIPLIAGLIAVAILTNVAHHAEPHRYASSDQAHAHDAYIAIAGINVPPGLLVHLPGMNAHAPLAWLLLATCLGIHIVGLLDDRKPMGPWSKLLSQLALAALLVGGGEYLAPGGFRVLTFLGNFPSPGFFLSAAASIIWIVALTNAFNFLDHMDGLSAGVAFISAAIFLIAAAANGQWFICAMLILFLGSVLGFLFYNFPPASIFMGDGGSMLLGFILAALTIRTTFLPPGAAFANHWYALLAPVIILAVPLYDFVIVSVLRIARGRSPMQGDTNHFSHRLTRHGFTRRGAVLVIYAVTLATGVTAPLLARVDDTSALLLFAQLLGMLVVIGILERVGEHTD
jgi:UDP-GlcNAc:undecaprenyl-phosphate/decaprenyl-phosphate GlcNAc-1-phosphate transferase